MPLAGDADEAAPPLGPLNGGRAGLRRPDGESPQIAEYCQLMFCFSLLEL